MPPFLYTFLAGLFGNARRSWRTTLVGIGLIISGIVSGVLSHDAELALTVGSFGLLFVFLPDKPTPGQGPPIGLLLALALVSGLAACRAPRGAGTSQIVRHFSYVLPGSQADTTFVADYINDRDTVWLVQDRLRIRYTRQGDTVRLWGWVPPDTVHVRDTLHLPSVVETGHDPNKATAPPQWQPWHYIALSGAAVAGIWGVGSLIKAFRS